MAKAIYKGLVPPDDPLFKTATIFTLPKRSKPSIATSPNATAGTSQQGAASPAAGLPPPADRPQTPPFR